MVRILQVNTDDFGGGAASVAWNLHRSYRAKGHGSWLAVGRRKLADPNVLDVPRTQSRDLLGRTLDRMVEASTRFNQTRSGPTSLKRALRILAEPQHALDWSRGIEDFNFPGTWQLLDLASGRPDIVQCHNLHGNYFDLRALPWLSHQIPLVLTLHDAWCLSGHCAHSFDCERWKTGCGHCPDLTIYPAVRRDATAFNWQRKRKIYSKSRLHVATPSRWLMAKVEASILSAGIVDARVIPNGVDLSTFHPAKKEEARSQLGLPAEARILLFAAKGIRSNVWKDYVTMKTAIGKVATRLPREKITFLALGEDAPPERVGGGEIRFAPYESDPISVARFYQAADVYVHAARADNFPLTVLEALACGLPVVATAVGGIAEQVQSGRTGFLVPPGDAESMAKAIETLLLDEGLRQRLSAEAATVATERFDLNSQTEEYLRWYRAILGSLPNG